MEHATLRENAAAWHGRLRQDCVSDETRAAFARWLAHSPEHRAAYETIEGTWSKLETVAHDPQILALRHETALRLTRRTSANSRSRWGRAAAAALILVALTIAIATLSTTSVRGRSHLASLLDVLRGQGDGRYATAIGERLTVMLKDGSQLTLNTRSELQVRFTPNERTVQLLRGQALFEVAKDPSRPFVVETAHRRFIAVGTAFDVRLDGERINVTMVEGTVRVERMPPPAPAASSRLSTQEDNQSRAAPTHAAVTSRTLRVMTITAGEQLTVDRETEERVRAADPERVTSWRRGQVIFDNTRLGDAIAELNRYSEKQIELADPKLADLRLSGAFATGRPTVFVEAVTTYFPIRIERGDEHGVVLSARN